MKRTQSDTEKVSSTKRQKRDVSPGTVAQVLAQIHPSDFEDDMSEPDVTPSTSQPSSTFHPDQYYHIYQTQKRSSRKFKTSAYIYTVKFKDFKSKIPMENVEGFVTKLFDTLLTTLKQRCQCQENDRLRISIDHDHLKSPVWIEFSSPEELTSSKMIDKIQHVQQSNDQFHLTDGKATLHMTHVSLPQGSGVRKKVLSVEGFRKTKRSLVQIQIQNTQDPMCLARAIVVGRTYADKNDTIEWKRNWKTIRQSDRAQQRNQAELLLQQAGLPKDKPCGLPDMQPLQNILAPRYTLKVHPQEVRGALLFRGPDFKDGKYIHVYHHDQHFDAITSIAGFLSYGYYCETCDRGYNSRENHQLCGSRCEGCLFTPACTDNGQQRVHCPACQRTFVNSTCYQQHLKTQGSQQKKCACQLLRLCDTCGQNIRTNNAKSHVCPGKKRCAICGHVVDLEHRCFIQKYQPNDDSKKGHFIFFDFECMQETGTHIPNFCVAHRACEKCIQEPILSHCSYCSKIPGGREKIFRGVNTLTEFARWILNPVDETWSPEDIQRYGKCHRYATVMAHNFSGYDGQFLLRYYAEHTTERPQVILNGAKIISMQVGHVHFKDSMSYLAMPLSRMPKTFGMTEMAKGYFPHFFNTQANQHAVLPCLPQAHYYDPDNMSTPQRDAFYAWYQKHGSDPFDFQEEMLKYCRSDVDILRRCCGKFRQLFMEYGDIDPLKEACTIAKACSLVYRKKFMPSNTLAIICPQTTDFVKRQYSVKALRWLHYLCDTEDKWIQHARNGGGEKTIGPYSLDGWDLEHPHRVYEFHGCLFHGCPLCYSERNTVNPFLQRTMEELYQATCQRRLFLEQQGYQVVEMWEHEYDQRMKTDPEFKQKVESYKWVDPLNPRDSLYGGRTNATCLLYHADQEKGEEIKYLDVCSLYPYVCKYCVFPVGHPQVMTEHIDLDHIRRYQGLIKCKVLPPTHLYHPLLPLHCQGKLMFPLCRTCAETCNQDHPCQHTQEERALTGTWVSVELFKALDLGYQLLEVYEICHFSETQQYHKGDETQKGIFADYVNAFLKLKQEASGYPSWCQTPEDQQRFKENYRQQEGITLDQVEKNEGRRSFAKVMLNCLWGKMAQRPTLTKTEYVTQPSRYFQMVLDPTKYVKHVEIVREDLILTNYEDKLDFVEPDTFGNVIIAAYVTAHARLKLYQALELLGERVLYFDTDSCIYIHRPGQPHPDIEGDRLGAWTDEHPNDKIISFASGGPKNYGYEYRDSEGHVHTQCKVKGLSLNYRTSQVVNFGVLKQALESGQSDQFQVTTYQPHKIVRLPTHRIVSRPLEKVYQIVYQKRVRLPNHFTLPYGHIEIGKHIKSTTSIPQTSVS